MTYNRITWAPAVLRAAGLTVVEHDGWETRGLSTDRPFDPQYVVWHHDASAPGDSPGVPAAMIARFETAAAQLWVDRAGRWHIIASGRAPHAGATLPGMPTNYNSIGVETDHTSGEDWPPALLASLRTGTAAILAHLGHTAAFGLHFHKTICSPVGRKIDPDGLDLKVERVRVAAATPSADPKPATKPKPAVSLAAAKSAARHKWVPRTKAEASAVWRIRVALWHEKLGGGSKGYAAWQRRLGYTGAAADGVPGHDSLVALGHRYGFRVVA